MIKILSLFLFVLWLLGAFGLYSIGWFFHVFLVVSIMLFFISTVHNKTPEITEIMLNNDLQKEEAEHVREIMHKNRLDEKEAIELLMMRSEDHRTVGEEYLLKTEAERIRKIMNKNKLDQREAVELLSLRLGLHHH